MISTKWNNWSSAVNLAFTCRQSLHTARIPGETQFDFTDFPAATQGSSVAELIVFSIWDTDAEVVTVSSHEVSTEKVSERRQIHFRGRYLNNPSSFIILSIDAKGAEGLVSLTKQLSP